MFGKGISSDTFKGRGDLSKRTRQRPSGRADVDVSAFEILILFALCPFHYANETGRRERGSFNKRAYYGARHRGLRYILVDCATRGGFLLNASKER